MNDLAGKRVLVTGASTGIGYATAQAFAEAGARLLIAGRDPQRIRQASERIAKGCRAVVADNASVADCARVAAACETELGGLDVLIVNAGICLASTIDTIDETQFDLEMATNFKGAVFLIQACLPLIAAGGSVLVTTSSNDAMGIAGQLVYSASKAALRSMVRTLAAELAPRGIRVNGVAPGPTDTPIFDKATPNPDAAAEMRAFEAKLTVLNRLARPEEVAEAFCFLASNRAGFITAIDLRVDGGLVDI